MLFVSAGKRSNSRSKMFYKMDALKNLSILEFLFNKPYWKEATAQVFSCEYCEMFKHSFLYRAPPVHCIFRKFYVMIEFFGRLWVQNWYFSYFLYHCLAFLQNSSFRIGNPLLFHIYLVFIPIFFSVQLLHALQRWLLQCSNWITKV